MSEEGGPVESPDLPEPHPDDPWHPAWTPDDAGPEPRERDPGTEALRRIHDRVRALTEDVELKTSLEAAAAGRRMLEQIAAVRDGGASPLFAFVGVERPAGDASHEAADPARRAASRDEPEGDVPQPEGSVVPESAKPSSSGWWGRLRKRGAPGADAADEEDATRGADVRGEGEMTDDRPVDDDVRDPDEPPIADVEPTQEDDFPWDDEDWSAARAADDPPDTRELDLVTPEAAGAADDEGVESADDEGVERADESVTSAPEVGVAEADSIGGGGAVEREPGDPGEEASTVDVGGTDPDVTLELEAVEPHSEEPSQAGEEGVFTHAEVIPLVRPPDIDADEATAGLDPDLLATADAEPADERSEPGPETLEPDSGAGSAVSTDGESTDADVVDVDDSDAADTDAADTDADDVEGYAAFSLEDYTGTATEEYAELARDVAASEDEALELAAISAEMPGLDTTLVGLDDVVDAGIGVTETISTTRRSDLGLRVATALGLLVVFFGSLLWPWAIGGLILVVLGVASLELYIVTVNAGFRPLTWAGLVGVVGALAGTWVWGVVAVPVALALTAIGATLFLALSAQRKTPLLDLALTVAMMAWIGVLGAPAFEIVAAPDFRWLILAVVLTTAFMDVAQYFVGRALGRRRLSPVVSPKKTVEGLAAGVFAALIVGVVFGSIEASPFDPGSGLAFGAVVAVVAPLGDLAVSVVKRALAVKDMSAILPGHGGIMDRIDAMVFVIPSAWIHFQYFDLLG